MAGKHSAGFFSGFRISGPSGGAHRKIGTTRAPLPPQRKYTRMKYGATGPAVRTRGGVAERQGFFYSSPAAARHMPVRPVLRRRGGEGNFFAGLMNPAPRLRSIPWYPNAWLGR